MLIFAVVRVFIRRTSCWQSATPTNICTNPIRVVMNPINGALYVGCSAAGVFMVSGSAITQVVNATTCSDPEMITVHEQNGNVYIACMQQGMLLVDSMNRVTNLPTNPGCIGVRSIAVNEQTNTVYAACISHGLILSVTAEGNVFGYQRCENGGDARSIVVNQLTGDLYVFCYPDGVAMINTNGILTYAIPHLKYVVQTSIAINRLNGTVYFPADNLYAISNQSAVILADLYPYFTYNNYGYPYSDVTVDSTNGNVYFTCPNCPNSILKYDGVSLSAVTTPNQCFQPQGISVDANTGVVFGACDGNSTVSRDACSSATTLSLDVKLLLLILANTLCCILYCSIC